MKNRQNFVAPCELGISLDDSRFVKGGHGLVEDLLSFRQSNGGFYHVLDGSDGNNQMSGEQGFYALVAIDRAANGKNSLYRMGDAAKNTAKPGTSVSKGNVDASVNVPCVAAPGTTFTDVKNHTNQTAIKGKRFLIFSPMRNGEYTEAQQKINANFKSDKLADFLEEIRSRSQFHYWLFGHYHDNRIVDEKCVLLFEQMVRVL